MEEITDKDNPTNTPSQSDNPSDKIVSPKDIETTHPNQHNEIMEIHKHPHHVTHKKKWPEYLLEFFMLFLAVFLGFLVENYRETLGVKFGVGFNITCYWDVVHKAQQLMNLPTPSPTIEEVVPKRVLQNTQIFIQYDKAAIQQLYSMMTNAKGTLTNTILYEKLYKEKAERLLNYLQEKYHLD